MEVTEGKKFAWSERLVAGSAPPDMEPRPGCPRSTTNDTKNGSIAAALEYPAAASCESSRFTTHICPSGTASYHATASACSCTASQARNSATCSQGRDIAMNAKGLKRLDSGGRDKAIPQTLKIDFRHGMDIYRRFNSFNPSGVVKIKYHRVIPPVVVELGKLVGLIYRSDKWQPHRSQTFIHLMDNPPRLVSDVRGTQLYIIGGGYRVTKYGIEG